MNTSKKVVSILLSAVLLFNSTGLIVAGPSAPSAPSAPEAPEAPSSPDAPDAPDAPEAPSAPTEPSETTPTPTPAPKTPSPTPTEPPTPTPVPSSDPTPTPAPVSGTSSSDSNSDPVEKVGDDTGGNEDNGNTDGATILTGDATSSAVIENDANKNLSASVADNTGISVVNDGNGSGSNNSGSATVSDDSLTIQNNTATVENNMVNITDSGHNEASKNLGDSVIVTGDSNTTGTILNTVNTNVDGIMVSEFNIVDDHVGDYVLDFDANCISGCGGSDLTAKNTGNADGSDNTSNVDYSANNETFQTNEADVENNMVLSANSGKNKTVKNNQGDSVIVTGDANVSASVLNFVNNNIAGDVIYGVVNIFGDLIGDIIVPESGEGCCGTGDIYASNNGNGSGSTNTTNVAYDTDESLYQFNNAVIENNIILDAETGGNDTSKNNKGMSYIETGDSNVEAQVLNIANTNTSGEDMFLVLVNEAGKWFGKILGSDGNIGGSEGWAFTTNEYGEIMAVNSANGDGSTNTTNVTSTKNNTTVQNNNAKIVNNLDLSANTGKNEASKNNGGHSLISTGDANVVANIVNFVNNNIAGSGKLYVTTVNVFGNWFGDFITPGHEKEEGENQDSVADNAIGGYSSQSSSNSDSSGGSKNNTSSETEVASYEISIAKEDEDYKAKSQYKGVLASAEVVVNTEVIPEVNASETSIPEKTININLAWLILLLPVLIGAKVVKAKVIPAFRKD